MIGEVYRVILAAPKRRWGCVHSGRRDPRSYGRGDPGAASAPRRDSYGYEINKNIENCSGGEFVLKEATLYTAFRRLEDSGYITSYWGDEAVGARRKYYRITEKGREAYRQARAEWDASVRILNALLEGEA